jgi:4-hydroxy-3-polyprenylbenzoate decarboxylase
MDLRAFIDLLAHEGRLRRVSREVDWKFELGEMVRAHRSPILFEKIKDYPRARVFANGLSGMVEIGLALGLGAGLKRRDLIRELKRRKPSPLHTTAVPTGPVLENVSAGEAIDLLRFAVPHWHRQDCGRYLGTWHINVSKHPETGARNVGVYRMALLGPRQATISTSPASHLGLHVAAAERRGQPLPMAVAIGVSEAVVMAASAAYPYGLDEFDLAGGLQRESVRLLPCETVNLEVPADSEIVIEGVIKPGVRVPDGPFFDYAGKPSVNPHAFLFEATRVMSRNDPIFRGASIGMAGAEDHQLAAVLANLDLLDFHGNRTRERLQHYLIKNQWFKAFQWAGRIGGILRG